MDRFIEIVRNVGCHPVSRRIRGHFAPELLRTGVPIIATDVDGIPEFVYLTRRTPGSTGDLARRSGAGLARMLDEPDRLTEPPAQRQLAARGGGTAGHSAPMIGQRDGR